MDPYTSGVLINSQKDFQNLNTTACYIRSEQERDGKECPKINKISWLCVFALLCFVLFEVVFFPDLCASQNASFISGSAGPLVSMRYLPPSEKTNSESKLNKTEWNRPPCF